MAYKIKVKKEKVEGNETIYVAYANNEELAWNYTAALAMQSALESVLAERNKLRTALDKVHDFKQSLRNFLS